MFRWAAFLGLAGLAVATGIIIWSGWSAVLEALAQAGWGILAVAAFHFVPLTISTEGWRALIPGKKRPSLGRFIYFMWIRAAINNLLPVARIGGEIAVVRLMTDYGMRRSIAIAATVVELTLSFASVFLFVVIGVIMFGVRVSDEDVMTQLIWGLILSLPLLAAMAAVQKVGFFGLLSRVFRTLFRDKWAGIAGSAARLDRAVTTMYKHAGTTAFCGFAQFLGWCIGSIEIWMSLYFLGHPLSFAESFMIEALIQGSASAAFAVPGALGVQEAGFLVFGGMLGLPREVAAALAVIRRCRDLIIYIPGLIVWQAHEGRKLLKA